MTGTANENQLTHQARDGVRRVPWKTVLAGAGGASIVALLAVSGFGPLISAIAIGALSVKEVQDWLANLGANALSGWFAEWATGAVKEALADPVERERRAAELDQRATTDPAIAVSLAKLLEAIDAVPQSLAALTDEVGAQSDLLLEQHDLLKRLSVDVQRAGLDNAELRRFVAGVTASEADRVIGAVTAHADEQSQAILAELRALRDAQRAVVNLSGAQTGDVTFQGDVAGRDVHKPTVSGGIYAAPGSSVTINQGPGSASQALYQLRAPVGDFVGREKEIEQLVQALSKGAAASICGLRGMGGIGKTELAYVVADRLRAVYPDGQIFVELRGASNSSLSPEQGLQTVIRAFEREAKLPDDLSQLQAHYRSVLAGKRVLVLADDAKDAAQVRPLLPPSGCALLVTSRNRFSLPKMVGVDLSTLPSGEAEALLLEVCPRIGDHAAELARLCGYLPLALRVSASLLAASDTRSVARYLQQLEQERLKLLSDPDDPAASVEASLRLSYDALEPAAQSALCQISVFPTSFDLEAARAIVLVEGEVEEVLELLRRRSLLEWDTALERYSQHELLGVFAAARLEEDDSLQLRHAQYFTTVAWKAGGELYTQGGTAMQAGLALFDRERMNIDAGWSWARGKAGSLKVDRLIFHFAIALLEIGSLRYHARHERLPQLEEALAATQRLGDKQGEAAVLGSLGVACSDLGDVRKAIEYYKRSFSAAREVGHHQGRGAAIGNLGLAYAKLGNAHKAIQYHHEHLDIARNIGDRRGMGTALGNLGIAYAKLGNTFGAISYNMQHLDIAREIGDRRGEGTSLGNLGLAYAKLGDTRRAVEHYEQHLAIASEIGDRQGEAVTSWNLGRILVQEGRSEEALPLLKACVAYESEIGHPDAEPDTAIVEYVRQHGRWPDKPSSNEADEGSEPQ